MFKLNNAMETRSKTSVFEWYYLQRIPSGKQKKNCNVHTCRSVFASVNSYQGRNSRNSNNSARDIDLFPLDSAQRNSYAKIP